MQPADGTGVPQSLTEGRLPQWPMAVTSDGSMVVYRQADPNMGMDLYALSLNAERRDTSLIATPFTEQNADISPDGRWIAYQSNESSPDQTQVYVRPFPNTDGPRSQVSGTEGGNRPVWARGGGELFYLDAEGHLMTAPVRPGTDDPGIGTPTRLLDRVYVNAGPGRTYDVAPDDRRFLMVKAVESAGGTGATELVVVLNWFEDLKRLVPN